MITENLIDRLSAMASARMAKPPVLPERHQLFVKLSLHFQ